MNKQQLDHANKLIEKEEDLRCLIAWVSSDTKVKLSGNAHSGYEKHLSHLSEKIKSLVVIEAKIERGKVQEQILEYIDMDFNQ